MTIPIPSAWRSHLAHAAAQRIADEWGVDILHLKGPALHPGLLPYRRYSHDADILVRPTDWTRLTDGLSSLGWVQASGFDSASDFGHAANWFHPHWGYLDLHRSWPGITIAADVAFDRLWEDRGEQQIAHWPCAVPAVPAQVLILLLHAARSPRHPDLIGARRAAVIEYREPVAQLVRDLRAEVAFAAGIGELDAFENEPAHDLWQLLSRGESNRVAIWRARVRAANGVGAKWAVIRSMWTSNRDWLRMELQREPTNRDLVRHQRDRILHLLRGFLRGNEEEGG